MYKTNSFTAERKNTTDTVTWTHTTRTNNTRQQERKSVQ